MLCLLGHKKQTESPSTPLPGKCDRHTCIHALCTLSFCYSALEYRCVCQMFCKEEDESIKNSWKVIFAFVSSKSDLQVASVYYNLFEIQIYFNRL